MMSDQQFDLKLKHIEEQYAARREGAEAYRDQEMARLFGGCGWTQERIATRLGWKRHSQVSRRLVFGRFLAFVPTGTEVGNLTERRFREYWGRAKGKEADRFAQVADILANGIPHGYAAMHDKPAIRAAVIECLSDGKWYTIPQITATVDETQRGVVEDQVRGAITRLRLQPPVGHAIEAKSIGKKTQYRLSESKTKRESRGNDPRVISLYEQAAPLIEELRHWGRSSKYSIPPTALEHIAIKLERLFEAVLAHEPA